MVYVIRGGKLVFTHGELLSDVGEIPREKKSPAKKAPPKPKVKKTPKPKPPTKKSKPKPKRVKKQPTPTPQTAGKGLSLIDLVANKTPTPPPSVSRYALSKPPTGREDYPLSRASRTHPNYQHMPISKHVYKKVSPTVPVHDITFIPADPIGQGVFGDIYRLGTKTARELIGRIHGSRGQYTSDQDMFTVFRSLPPLNKEFVVMKIQIISSDTYNELKIMETLQGLPFIPKLYAAGNVILHGEYRHIILMEFIDGVTLREALFDTRYNKAKIEREINKALIQMWKRGVIHADLHWNNIMVDKKSNIHIIDYNFSHETQHIQDVAQSMPNDGNARKLWKNHLEDYANTIVRERKYRGYNPNSKILAYMRSLRGVKK